MGSQNRTTIISWIILALAASFLRHLPLMAAPFDRGYAGKIGSRYQGAIQKTWDQDGLVAKKFRPIVKSIPTVPISGETYLNHPTFFHYVERFFVYYFGLHEFALRFYPALGAAICAALLVFLALGRWGHLGAGIMLSVQLASPGLLYYGSAANYESTGTMFLLLAVMASTCERQRTRVMLVALFSFLATSHEWAGGLVVVGLLGGMIYRRRFDRGVLAASVLGCGAMILTHILLVAYWDGSIDGALEELWGVARLAKDPPASIGVWDFCLRQFQFLIPMWGWLSLPLVLVPFLPKPWLFAGIEDLRGVVATWLPIHATWVLLVPGRSFDHEFWGYWAHPGLMLVQTGVLVAIAQNRWRLFGKTAAKIALFGLLSIGLLVPLCQRIVQMKTQDPKGELAIVRDSLSETDYVMTTRWTGHWYFYLRCGVWDFDIDEVERDRIIQLFRDGKLPGFRRFLVVVYANVRDESGQARRQFLGRNPDFEFAPSALADFYILKR